MPIINGKLRLKQNQLLFIHQLSQEIRLESGVRMSFDSPEKLCDIISYATQSKSPEIRRKLQKSIDSFSPDFKNIFLSN